MVGWHSDDLDFCLRVAIASRGRVVQYTTSGGWATALSRSFVAFSFTGSDSRIGILGSVDLYGKDDGP